MKILMSVPCLEKPGGVAVYYRTVREHFSEDVDYFTIGARERRERVPGVFIRLLRDYRDFLRKLKTDRYDLVHLNPSLTSKAIVRDGVFLLIAKALRVKVLVSFRGWNVDVERVIRRYFPALFRLVYFQADAMIVLAAEFRLALIEMGCRKPVHTETTVVSDDIFARTECRPRPAALDTAQRRFKILFLSRVEKTKGIYETLDAFQILRTKCPFAALTIAGDGSELAQARKYATDHDIDGVSFAGYLRGEEKHEAFTQADVYLLPTYGEGMPHSVLEAMAYGLPVVTRPVGGLRDFFEDGRMGFLTESYDPAVFAECLGRLVEDRELRTSIGYYNRQYAAEHFVASKVVARLEAIYHSVIANSGA